MTIADRKLDFCQNIGKNRFVLGRRGVVGWVCYLNRHSTPCMGVIRQRKHRDLCLKTKTVSI